MKPTVTAAMMMPTFPPFFPQRAQFPPTGFRLGLPFNPYSAMLCNWGLQGIKEEQKQDKPPTTPTQGLYNNILYTYSTTTILIHTVTIIL